MSLANHFTIANGFTCIQTINAKRDSYSTLFSASTIEILFILR